MFFNHTVLKCSVMYLKPSIYNNARDNDVGRPVLSISFIVSVKRKKIAYHNKVAYSWMRFNVRKMSSP